MASLTRWTWVWVSSGKSYDQPRQHIKKQRHYFADKGPYSQSYGFPRSHVWMWELDNKKGWALKNWCLWTVMLEMTLESPLDCKDIKPVNPKGNQLWIFIGKTDVKSPNREQCLVQGFYTSSGFKRSYLVDFIPQTHISSRCLRLSNVTKYVAHWKVVFFFCFPLTV